jgi:hypothetical protein
MLPLIPTAIAFSTLLAVVIAVAIVKAMRNSREQQAARIEALRALAADLRPEPEAEALPPALLEVEKDDDLGPPAIDEPWDLAFRDETLMDPADLQPEPVPAFVESRRAREQPRRRPRQQAVAAVPMLFEEAVPRAPNGRMTGFAAVALVLVLGGGTFYLVSSGVIGRLAAATATSVRRPAPAAPIELLSLRHAVEPGAIVVTGLVQNPSSGSSLQGVQAVVYLFDAEGHYFANSRAPLESTVLSPGGEAAFVVRVAAPAPATRYRVSFQQEDGTAVNHVDKRGQLPAGTSGDTVETPAVTPVVNARRDG